MTTSGGVMPGGICRSELRERRDLRQRRLDVGVRLEEHLDDRQPGQRLRLDVLDVVDERRHAALAPVRDAVLHLLGRQPGKVKTRLMTGMSISGKMSVGVRDTTGVSRRIASAITMNVYGRDSATRTNHMAGSSILGPTMEATLRLLEC